MLLEVIVSLCILFYIKKYLEMFCCKIYND